MAWTIARVALIFVAGPLLSLFVLFHGCAGESPALGAMCGHNSATSLVLFTVGISLVLGTLAALVRVLLNNE